MRICLIISFIFIFSCTKKKEIPSVDHFFELKLEDLQLEREAECQEKALIEAEKFVDELIDRWVKNQGRDSIAFPLKPKRPKAPNQIIKKKN